MASYAMAENVGKFYAEDITKKLGIKRKNPQKVDADVKNEEKINQKT